jgi:hypothetical protein
MLRDKRLGKRERGIIDYLLLIMGLIKPSPLYILHFYKWTLEIEY